MEGRINLGSNALKQITLFDIKDKCLIKKGEHTQVCRTCKIEKPFRLFNTKGKFYDGYSYLARDCTKCDTKRKREGDGGGVNGCGPGRPPMKTMKAKAAAPSNGMLSPMKAMKAKGRFSTTASLGNWRAARGKARAQIASSGRVDADRTRVGACNARR